MQSTAQCHISLDYQLPFNLTTNSVQYKPLEHISHSLSTANVVWSPMSALYTTVSNGSKFAGKHIQATLVCLLAVRCVPTWLLLNQRCHLKDVVTHVSTKGTGTQPMPLHLKCYQATSGCSVHPDAQSDGHFHLYQLTSEQQVDKVGGRQPPVILSGTQEFCSWNSKFGICPFYTCLIGAMSCPFWDVQ